jgi:hypothetical protein
MGKTIECYFWSPTFDLDETLQYTYEDAGNGITLKKPIFTLDACATIIEGIKKARSDYLRTHDIPAVLDTIGKVNDHWMDPAYTGRELAREILPTVTGFSVQMIESWGFGQFFTTLKKENLPVFGKLQPQNFREFSKLGDGLVKAYGLPAFEIVMDKLVDAATWVKVPTEEPVFGALYAKSIQEVDPALAETIAILPFGSENTAVQEFLISHSDLVRATGGELARKNLTEIAEKHHVPLAGHWHKFSFITIAKEYLGAHAREIAELASLDVSAWDQQGCFSPQEIFVETGGQVSPQEFAQLLGEEMERTAQALPKGINSGKIQVLDGYYQYLTKEMMGEPVKLFPSPSYQWLVIYDENIANFEPSPLFRVIRVKPVDDIMEIPQRIKPLGRFLQTVGVAIPMTRLLPFADALGDTGVTNIRTISGMTLQKAWEPWDGRFPLQELFEHDGIHWTSIDTREIEKEMKIALARKRSVVDQQLPPKSK